MSGNNIENIIKNNYKKPYLFSAPIAGFTNSIMREIFAQGGADFIFSEMYNVNEILNLPINYLDLKKTNYKLIIQLFGSFEDNFIDAIDKIKHLPHGIDINAGCPVKKVIKAKSGSYLLNYPDKIYKLLYKIKKNHNIRLSIKLRLGFDKINILETVEAATKANIDFITIHFRTRNQFFSGTIDWDNYFNLYEEILKIYNRIVINGDINSLNKALYLINKYSPYGIMIGRASLNDPFIFKKIKEFYIFNNLYNYQKNDFINYYLSRFRTTLNKCTYFYNCENYFHNIIQYLKYNNSENFNNFENPINKKIINYLLYKQNIELLKTIYNNLYYKISQNIKIKNLKLTEFRKIAHYLLKGLPNSSKIKTFINSENDVKNIIEYLNKLK